MKEKIKEQLNKSIASVKESDISKVINDAKIKIESISKNPEKYIKELYMQAKLAYEMVLCYLHNECSFPWKSIAAMVAVLLYLINPLDLIPDFIPGIGYIDDLAAFGIAFSLISDDLKQYALSKGIDLKEYGLEEDHQTEKY